VHPVCHVGCLAAHFSDLEPLGAEVRGPVSVRRDMKGTSPSCCCGDGGEVGALESLCMRHELRLHAPLHVPLPAPAPAPTRAWALSCVCVRVCVVYVCVCIGWLGAPACAPCLRLRARGVWLGGLKPPWPQARPPSPSTVTGLSARLCKHYDR